MFWAFPSRQIAIQSLLTGERRVLIEDRGGYVKYLPTGHLVYVRDGTMFGVRFDLQEHAVTGSPVPLVEGVAEGQNDVAQIDVSETGSLVYVPGTGPEETLVWVDRQGREEPVPLPTGRYGGRAGPVRLSRWTPHRLFVWG